MSFRGQTRRCASCWADKDVGCFKNIDEWICDTCGTNATTTPRNEASYSQPAAMSGNAPTELGSFATHDIKVVSPRSPSVGSVVSKTEEVAPFVIPELTTSQRPLSPAVPGNVNRSQANSFSNAQAASFNRSQLSSLNRGQINALSPGSSFNASQFSSFNSQAGSFGKGQTRRCAHCWKDKELRSFVHANEWICGECAPNVLPAGLPEITKLPRPQSPSFSSFGETPNLAADIGSHKAMRRCMRCDNTMEMFSFTEGSYTCNSCARTLKDIPQQTKLTVESEKKTIKKCARCRVNKLPVEFFSDKFICEECVILAREGKDTRPKKDPKESPRAPKVAERHQVAHVKAAKVRTFVTGSTWFERKCQASFMDLDLDESGFLDTTEVYAGVLLFYTKVLPWVTTAVVPSVEVVHAMTEEIDLDHSGKLDYEEFKALLVIVSQRIGRRVLIEAIAFYIAAPLVSLVVIHLLNQTFDPPEFIPPELLGICATARDIVITSLFLMVIVPRCLSFATQVREEQKKHHAKRKAVGHKSKGE